MSDYIQFQRLITYQWLNKEQLKLANDFILKQMNDDDYSEYYYDMFCFVEKCFKVLKKQSIVRLGLTVCKGNVVDFLLGCEHKNCSCSSVLFNTKLY